MFSASRRIVCGIESRTPSGAFDVLLSSGLRRQPAVGWRRSTLVFPSGERCSLLVPHLLLHIVPFLVFAIRAANLRMSGCAQATFTWLHPALLAAYKAASGVSGVAVILSRVSRLEHRHANRCGDSAECAVLSGQMHQQSSGQPSSGLARRLRCDD